MDIFNTTFETAWHDSMRAIRFANLQKLAGASADRFECLKPLPSQNVLGACREKRKSKFVEVLIDLLLSGVDASLIPSGCSCEQLYGTLCGWAGTGFTEILAAIEAVDTPIDAGTEIVSGTVNTVLAANTVSIVLPVGATLLNILPPRRTTGGSENIAIRSINGTTGTVVVTFVAAPAVDTFAIAYSYAAA